MKRISKRILSFVLAAGMSLSLVPAALAAEETPERGTLSYEVAIQPQYEDAAAFSDGLAAVKKDGKWGYIDEDGNTVIPFEYDFACDFSEGYAVVAKLVDSKSSTRRDGYGNLVQEVVNTYNLGFIDSDNNYTQFRHYSYELQADSRTFAMELVDCQYKGTSLDLNRDDYIFYNGYVILYEEYFDTTGCAVKWIYDEYRDYYKSPLARYPLTEGTANCYEIFDIASKSYLSLDALYTNPGSDSFQLRPFNQGIAPMYRSTWEGGTYVAGWGFIDKNLNWVIQPIYTDFVVSGAKTIYKVFGETGLAMVQNADGKWGAIDKTGNTVIDFQYDNLYPYSFGLAAFSQDGKWGYLDSEGNVAIEAQYEVTSGFGSDGYAVAYDGQNVFLIDTKGNTIPGTGTLDLNTYIKYEEGSDVPTTYRPTEYVVINEDGKYGFAHVTYLPALPEVTDMSSWSYTEVVAAIEEDLVPNYLQNLYLNNITRDEFCDLIIQALETVTGKDIADLVLEKTGNTLDSYRKSYPFIDSTSANVIAANALGIIGGRGNGIFDPYTTITRQEAAVLLTRSATVLGVDTSNISRTDFADSESVATWAKDAICFVSQINVMSGTGNNNFSPLGTYTREQSFVTIYRLFQAIMEG